MEKLKAENFIEAIKSMSVLELSNIIKSLEEEFGVSQINFGGGSKASEETTPAEKTEFELVLNGLTGTANKVEVIKIVKQITNLSLKEAKDIVDGAPKSVKQGLAKEEAENLAKQLKDAGAEIELK